MKVHAPELMKELVYSYRDAGDYRKALDYSLACRALRDSVFTLSRERTLHENRIRHEIYANERLIDEQRMELMATRHRMILLAVCVAAAVARCFGLFQLQEKRPSLSGHRIAEQRIHGP